MESKNQQRAELVKTGTLQFFLAIALGLLASIVANAFVEELDGLRAIKPPMACLPPLSLACIFLSRSLSP
jgi:hypothetical protein